MAFYGISAASGGHLNFDNGYRGLQISSYGLLSVARSLNIILFDQPTWCKEVGIQRTAECGNGTQIQLIWKRAIASSQNRTLAYNIYFATKRVDVFREGVKFLTDKTSVVLNGFTPGDQIYFGIRATDYPPVFDIANLIVASQDVYLPMGDKGNEECNQSIGFSTPHYDFPNGPAGGRIIPESTLVTPSDSFDDDINFNPYDYGGWHRQRFDDYYSGKCIGSYAGGEQLRRDASGNAVSVRGLPLGERHKQRLEMLLQQGGQAVVLLRRKWEGEKATSVHARRESPRFRKMGETDFGTGFKGGYDQYINPRRDDTKLLIRLSPFTEDLKHDKDGALMQEAKPEAWTLPTPLLRDRDVIVQYDHDDPTKEIWRYEILHVTRNKLILGNTPGAQKFTMQRMDKTDPIYRVSVVLP